MRPFISYDGADAKGVRAEVHVQAGTGTVTKIEGLDENGRNVQVIVQSDNGAVKKPIKGWLQRTDPLLQKVVEAQQSGAIVAYRTESQRKAHVDRALPIGPLRETTDLARENCITIFAGLDGNLSTEAVTNPSEDPAPGGRTRATDNSPAPAGGTAGGGVSVDNALNAVNVAATSGLPDGVLHAAMAAALAAGADAATVMRAATVNNTSSRPALQSAHASEAQRWHAYNTDGRVNLGSYAVGAMLAAEKFAHRLITAHIAETNPDAAGEPVDVAQAAAVAGLLMSLADRVQVGAYGGGRANRIASSHDRARSLVFDSIETRHPIPFGASDEKARTGWADAVVNECVQRFQHLAEMAMPQVEETRPSPAEQPAAEQQAPTEQTAQQPAQQQTPAAQPPAAQPAQQQAPAEQPAAAQQPGHILPGDAGFEAPTDDDISLFASLAQRAGFEPTPDSPLVPYLQQAFGSPTIRQAHAPHLRSMLNWYREQGQNAPSMFKSRVEEIAGQPA